MNEARENKTIFALASARGVAGISVIRISGKTAKQKTEKLLQNKELVDKKILVSKIFSPFDRQMIDHLVVLYFAAPHSFTGEDVVELHCHGSQAVLEQISNTLLQMGLFAAEAGEFTRRAFENGRLDLLQAEGLADLIDAQSEAQRQQALRQMDGSLSQHITAWRELLLAAVSRVEAEIDFPEEEDVSGELVSQIVPKIEVLQKQLQKQLKNAERGRQVRNGFHLVLVGPANAGKSTLLNALAGQQRAIVSKTPGTTRDVIEVQLQIAGFMVSVADTAGLRPAEDEIEQEGINRAKAKAKQADLRLFVSETGTILKNEFEGVQIKQNDLLIHSKADLVQASDVSSGWVAVCAQKTEGINELLLQLENKISKALCASEMPALTRSRHIAAVKAADVSLGQAKNQIGQMPELAAEHLREAGQHLALLLGEVHTEQVLDEIFRGFCIGK